MSKTDGVDVVVKADSVIYGGQMSTSLSLSADMIEVTSADSNKWKEYLAGEKGGTVSVELLYDLTHTEGAAEAFDDLSSGTMVTLYWGTETVDDINFSCDAKISSIELSASKNEAMTASLELQLSGEVTKSTNT